LFIQKHDFEKIRLTDIYILCGFLVALRQWNWREQIIDQGRFCDFDADGLGNAFRGLGLDPHPLYTDDEEEADGENECFVVEHGDIEKADPVDENVQPVPISQQEYHVNGKEYKVWFLFTGLHGSKHSLSVS
jgi:hypothetical protein